MPRLLPKLIESIKAVKHRQILNRYPRKDTKGSHPKPPSPNLSPHGRKQSILLDDVNPIIHSDAFVHHKRDAPRIPMVSKPKDTKDEDQLSEMAEHECKLWSNPYLRMLSSPLRQCLLTEQYLPADFMIRLAALKIHSPRILQPMTALLPDGLEHSRFKGRKSGRGWYVLCNKEAINQLLNRGTYKRIFSPTPLKFHALLAEQIGEQLRTRVLQELEFLTERLRVTPQQSLDHTVVRRLTRREWEVIKTTGLISQSGAMAVLVVPPVKKQKQSNGPSTTDEPVIPRSLPHLPPLSVMHSAQPDSTTSIISPIKKIPLYNGLTLFPSPVMRSKLFDALQKTLLVERRARWREGRSTKSEKQSKSREKDALNKASHAYLICADGSTVRRADSVPLAIALWRIRMWEGQGWEANLGNHAAWIDESDGSGISLV
ncbi:hypothetical protein BU17DRAFT_37441 [Hysterangium stoloniferum]|nr:hypothetical protein BU17DRAFT_37441 [Hysterangium stoloniferum]